jgi:general secretion pathway protein I
MSRPAARTQQRGFTLLEAVVAFAVLAISLGALYEAFGGSLLRSRQGEQRQASLLLAQSILAQTGSEQQLTAGIEQGEAGSLKWMREIKLYERPDRGAQSGHDRQGQAETRQPNRFARPAFDVSVRVVWGDGESQSVELHSLEVEGVP